MNPKFWTLEVDEENDGDSDGVAACSTPPGGVIRIAADGNPEQVVVGAIIEPCTLNPALNCAPQTLHPKPKILIGGF
jgi:hypothetical protein